jgi:hypothetical protein
VAAGPEEAGVILVARPPAALVAATVPPLGPLEEERRPEEAQPGPPAPTLET